MGVEQPGHRPVMVEEVLRYLVTDWDGFYVDCCFGGGGHSVAILEVLGSEGGVLGLDRDPAIVPAAQLVRDRFSPRLTIKIADYRRLAEMLAGIGRATITGALFDLGLSSLQLSDSTRGFAYRFDAPLDMRFGQDAPRTAAELLADEPEAKLTQIFREFGEEGRAAAVARAIVRARERRPIQTTTQLCELISIAIGRVSSPTLGRTSARIFQALRIAVNDELSAIEPGLTAAINALEPSGRVVAISYHSLEDRIVKNVFAERARACNCPRPFPRCTCGAVGDVAILTKKPLRPSGAEIESNPRSQSARLRAIEKRAEPRDFAHIHSAA